MTTTPPIQTIPWNQEPGSPHQAELYLHLHGPDNVWSEKAAWILRQWDRWQVGDKTAQWGPAAWVAHKRDQRAAGLPGAAA